MLSAQKLPSCRRAARTTTRGSAPARRSVLPRQAPLERIGPGATQSPSNVPEHGGFGPVVSVAQAAPGAPFLPPAPTLPALRNGPRGRPTRLRSGALAPARLGGDAALFPCRHLRQIRQSLWIGPKHRSLAARGPARAACENPRAPDRQVAVPAPDCPPPALRAAARVADRQALACRGATARPLLARAKSE